MAAEEPDPHGLANEIERCIAAVCRSGKEPSGGKSTEDIMSKTSMR
jgi:hypothetical protein